MCMDIKKEMKCFIINVKNNLWFVFRFSIFFPSSSSQCDNHMTKTSVALIFTFQYMKKQSVFWSSITNGVSDLLRTSVLFFFYLNFSVVNLEREIASFYNIFFSHLLLAMWSKSMKFKKMKMYAIKIWLLCQ